MTGAMGNTFRTGTIKGEIYNKFFTVRTDMLLKSFPRETVNKPSLEMSQTGEKK